MGKRPRQWLPAMLLALAQLSCATDFGVDANSPIDGRVKVSIFEGFPMNGQPGDPTIILAMQTEQTYGCINFSILADVDSKPGIITVTIRGIHKPEICLTAFGPATYRNTLPLSPGAYQLLVRNGSASDRHTLEVTGTSIRMTAGTSTVSIVSSTLSWRIPVRSFAYLCGTTVETAWMCESFRDSLLRIPSLREFTFPDSGDAPYPAASTGYWHNDPAKYFSYVTEADYDSAGAMLKRYTRQVIGDRQGIGLSLVNWRNIPFMSWVFSQNP